MNACNFIFALMCVYRNQYKIAVSMHKKTVFLLRNSFREFGQLPRYLRTYPYSVRYLWHGTHWLTIYTLKLDRSQNQNDACTARRLLSRN